VDEFRYVLKKFYKGGEFAPILNERLMHRFLPNALLCSKSDAVKENRRTFSDCDADYHGCFYPEMRFRSQP